MKLYEFNYIDEENMSEPTLLARVEAFLEGERDFQNWDAGYIFQHDQKPEHLPSGGKRYHFEVFGEYSDTDSYET